MKKFTFNEVLVIIAIIGTLAAMIIPAATAVHSKAKDIKDHTYTIYGTNVLGEYQVYENVPRYESYRTTVIFMYEGRRVTLAPPYEIKKLVVEK